VCTFTLLPAPRRKIGNLYTCLLASRRVQPVRVLRVVPVFLMTTYSALRLLFVPVSAPGESRERCSILRDRTRICPY
jgi:hypothetical protein